MLFSISNVLNLLMIEIQKIIDNNNYNKNLYNLMKKQLFIVSERFIIKSLVNTYVTSIWFQHTGK